MSACRRSAAGDHLPRRTCVGKALGAAVCRAESIGEKPLLGRIQWARQGVAGLPEFRRQRVLAAAQLQVCTGAAWRSTRSSIKGIDGVVGSPGARLCHQGEQAKLGGAWLNVHGGGGLRSSVN